MMRAFIRYFAERSNLANVITLMIMFLGLSTLMIIQRDNFPSVDFDEMVITTRYPGASPEDVELNVTNKIEEELKQVDGLDTVNSFSMENISVIKLKLDADSSDKDKIKSDVRDAVSRVSDLPAGVDEKPLVDEITTATGIPIIEVGLTGKVEYKILREWARRIEKALQDVTGVASLRKYGYLDREIKIKVAQDVVERFQIPTQDIVAAISNRNIRSTGGSFKSYTNEKKIVTLAQFQNPLEVNDVIIRANSGGTFLRVHDLAVLQDDFEPAKVLSRMNGKSAISFLVYKKESADIIRTIDAVKSLMERYQARMPEGVSIDLSNDTSRLVRNRLGVVSTNGLLGLLLVFVVLATFLNLRSAIWVAMGIPVSLLGTLFLLPMFGAYLDSISLAAMILVIGIIVDDGIVIAESIWWHMEEGLAPLDAAVEGTSAVFQPVLATILTTALAFAPMFFMSGTMGSFIYVIPLVVMLALAISFIEISLALPAHLITGAKALPGSVQEENSQGFFRQIQEQFGRFLYRLIRMRYAVIGLFLALLLTVFWYASRYMDFVLFPTQSADTIYLTVELDSGSSLENTAEKLREVEQVVLDLPEEERDSFVTRIGSHGDFSMGENENWALLGIYLTPFSERSRNADQIVESMRKRIEKMPGIVNTNFIIDGGGPPIGRPITLRVVGSDDVLRKQLAEHIVDKLNAIEGVKDIDRDDKQGKAQIRIDLDYLRLADATLTVADVARVVRLAYDGEVVTSVRYGDEDVEFRVIMEASARESANALGSLVIPNQEGRFVALKEVAQFQTEPGPANFFHYDNERAVTITADVIKEKTTPLNVTQKIVVSLDLEKSWPGLRVIVGGEAEETGESMASLGVAFLSAIVGIYLILLLLLNSVWQPLMVLMIIPFGMLGVIAAFALHHESIGFLAMMGVIGLTGIVVNDSLILANLVNKMSAQEERRPFQEILVEATQRRLRPIMLTSITTVAGILPMAYGIGGSDPFSAPMALAMGYGILFATPLTLVLLPCLLAVHADVGERLRGLSL